MLDFLWGEFKENEEEIYCFDFDHSAVDSSSVINTSDRHASDQ